MVTFLDKYSHTTDVNFASYSLGEVYESIGEKNNAIDHYKQVKRGAWKRNAVNRLEKLGAITNE